MEEDVACYKMLLKAEARRAGRTPLVGTILKITYYENVQLRHI